MRTLLPILLVLISFIFCPASDASSLPPEDLEASGDDLEMEGSGSGGGEVILDEKSTVLGSSKDGTDSTNNDKPAPKILLKDNEVEPWDREPSISQESKGFVESKEVLAGVIAGGVIGLVLAALLGGILIYKWQKKDTSGYAPGHTAEQYHTDIVPHRGEDMVLV